LCIIVSHPRTERVSIHVYMYPHTYTVNVACIRVSHPDTYTVRECGVYQCDSLAHLYMYTTRKACTLSPTHLYSVWCIRKKESVHDVRIHRHGNTKITYKHTYICKSIHIHIYPHTNIVSIYIYIHVPTHICSECGLNEMCLTHILIR